MVELRIKYGRPMVAASSIRIRRVGSPASSGFHEALGRIGSNRQLTSSRPP